MKENFKNILDSVLNEYPEVTYKRIADMDMLVIEEYSRYDIAEVQWDSSEVFTETESVEELRFIITATMIRHILLSKIFNNYKENWNDEIHSFNFPLHQLSYNYTIYELANKTIKAEFNEEFANDDSALYTKDVQYYKESAIELKDYDKFRTLDEIWKNIEMVKNKIKKN